MCHRSLLSTAAGRFALALVILAAVFPLTGCSSGHRDSSGLQPISSSDARALNASRNQFESSEDPPVTAQTHFAAGQLAESQNSSEAAIKQYQEALKLEPNQAPALYRLGVLYAGLKQYPEAIRTWTTYVKVTGESADAYSNLGFCQELAGRPDEAQAAYQQGIERDPRNKACRTNYGLMLARHGHVGLAVRVWQPVLTAAQIHYNLASVYELDGRPSEARAEYGRALALDPSLTDAKARLAALDQP